MSIMLKIGAKSIHSDFHINQISNFVYHLLDRNQANHKISSNWSIEVTKIQTHIHCVSCFSLEMMHATFKNFRWGFAPDPYT